MPRAEVQLSRARSQACALSGGLKKSANEYNLSGAVGRDLCKYRVFAGEFHTGLSPGLPAGSKPDLSR